jgi:lipopolysaccharide transport system permease protein
MRVPRPLALPVQYRTVLWAMVVQSLRDRLAGSVFGVLFLVVYPLIFLGVYSLVFIHILKVRVPNLDPEAYAVAIFCGLVPFLAFAEAFAAGTASTVSNAGLVRNMVFPYELAPLKDVLTSHIALSVGMAMIFAAALVKGGFAPTQLLLPVVYALQIVFTVGLVWITSTVNVFFRDMSKLVPIVVLFLMMVSPIGYTEDMVSPDLRAWLSLNPLAWFIFAYRDLLLDHQVPWGSLAGIAAASTALYLFGYAVMSRLRPIVYDYV